MRVSLHKHFDKVLVIFWPDNGIVGYYINKDLRAVESPVEKDVLYATRREALMTLRKLWPNAQKIIKDRVIPWGLEEYKVFSAATLTAPS